MSARIDSGFSCVRTCICCRGKARRDELLRLVEDSEIGVILDSGKTLPGRGAWVHLDCVGALRPGMLQRALRVEEVSQQSIKMIQAKLKEKDLYSAPGGIRE